MAQHFDNITRLLESHMNEGQYIDFVQTPYDVTFLGRLGLNESFKAHTQARIFLPEL